MLPILHLYQRSFVIPGKWETEATSAATAKPPNVATAVAEKLAAMGAATFFRRAPGRADFEAFDRLMRREVCEPPRLDDALA